MTSQRQLSQNETYFSWEEQLLRLRTGAALNVYDRSTFYIPTALSKDNLPGYTDYPDVDGTMGVAGKYALMEQGDIGTSLAESSKEPQTHRSSVGVSP